MQKYLVRTNLLPLHCSDQTQLIVHKLRSKQWWRCSHRDPSRVSVVGSVSLEPSTFLWNLNSNNIQDYCSLAHWNYILFAGSWLNLDLSMFMISYCHQTFLKIASTKRTQNSQKINPIHHLICLGSSCSSIPDIESMFPKSYNQFDWKVQWQKEGDSLARYSSSMLNAPNDSSTTCSPWVSG
jgi:hypothetical protein